MWIALATMLAISCHTVKPPPPRRLTDLPPAAQATVQEQLDGGTVVKIERPRMRGPEAFAVTCQQGDQMWHLGVAANGRYFVPMK